MNAKKSGRWFSAASALMALSGCAAVVLFSMEPEQRAALFLTPADKAVIYFYHAGPGGAASAPAVYLDGEPLGAPTSAGFWYREVAPGVHSVALANEPGDNLAVKVEAGHVYFVGEEVDCAARRLPYLHTVNEAEGRARVRALVAASKAPPAETGAPAPACRSDDGSAALAL